jgi:hypothetical protein
MTARRSETAEAECGWIPAVLARIFGVGPRRPPTVWNLLRVLTAELPDPTSGLEGSLIWKTC